ncbi:proton channel OtopLc isoform X2 [Dermacentor silvarum]|uniref:proton channel OtopLc isoform X2 n=1 Tax=Dermacentor silvarum TaxID=543639 RepID=UPI00210105D3|nr:proton channel OtopLc isoform X2 [Dermacentor silvarum]
MSNSGTYAASAVRELGVAAGQTVQRRKYELDRPAESFQLDSFVGTPEITAYRKQLQKVRSSSLQGGGGGGGGGGGEKTTVTITRLERSSSEPCTMVHARRRQERRRRVESRSFSVDLSRRQNEEMLWSNLASLLSYIYATLIVVLGGVMTVVQTSVTIGRHTIELDDAFACVVCVVGLTWLVFLHGDLTWHDARRSRRPTVPCGRGSSSCTGSSTDDVESVATGDAMDWKGCHMGQPHGYTYLTGRHSGSFYLKAGMTVFCCGHLIHEGLLLGQEIIAWMHAGEVCTDIALLLVHSLRPLFSFYQLYFLFKYSNIVINRWVTLAKFGIMHCFATTLTFWFRTVVNDAYGDVVKAFKGKASSPIALQINTSFAERQLYFSERPEFESNWSCAVADLFSPAYIKPMPYLYPFAIEFNLVLAGVWFIVLQNVGTSAHKYCRHDSTAEACSAVTQEAAENNLIINADCHSANRGLFAGFVVLLGSVVVMIIFYVALLENSSTGVAVYLGQEGVLIGLAFFACLLAYGRVATLDVNSHPITMLDDFLLCIPIPFFFAHATLVAIAELEVGGSYVRMTLQLFSVVQVVTQTPLIIDALRRCSNSPSLRYKKPGREIVSFLIVVNITMWIVYTFESKAVGKLFTGTRYFGLRSWVFIEHTTVPLMLFYRFHSSVCLADVWKSAYEAE